MKTFFIVLSGIVLHCNLNAQVFQKSYNQPVSGSTTTLACMEECSDGGFVFGGNSGNGTTSGPYICKTDSAGNVQWTTTLLIYPNNTTSNEYTWDVSICANGEYVALGVKDTLPAGNVSLFFSRFSSSGSHLWTKQYYYGRQLYFQRVHALEMANGDFTLAANSDSAQFLVRTDANGTRLWSKEFHQQQTAGVYNPGFNMVETSGGGLLLCGTRNGQLMLSKCDASGTPQWSRTYTTAGNTQFRSIIKTNDQHFVLAGFNVNYNALLKVDSTGQVIWQKAYQYVGINTIWHSVAESPSGDLHVFAGSTTAQSNPVIFRFDATGNFMDAPSLLFSDPDYAFSNPKSGTATADNGFVLGTSLTDLNTFLSAALLVKTGAGGQSACAMPQAGLQVVSSSLTADPVATLLAVNYGSQLTTGPVNSGPLVINATSNCVTSTGETAPGKETGTFRIYPNLLAAGETGSITITGAANRTISICDLRGRIISHGMSNSSGEIQLPAGLLQQGIYLVRINETGFTGKIVVQ